MNRIRRKQLSTLADRIEELKSELEAIMDEENETRDNMPESLQGSARYEASENASDAMDSAYAALEEAQEYISSAIEGE